MEGLYSLLRLFSIVYVLHVGVHCVPVSDSNGTASEDIDGRMLIKLGRLLNKPMLTLVGMAIKNLHPCAEWTQWSECTTSTPGYFGMRTRARECGMKSITDSLDPESRIEADLGICEGGSVEEDTVCPHDYQVTTNGFCVKLYNTTKSLDDAEKQCADDGGFLINVDSELKFEDVKTLTLGLSDMYVGGRQQNSQWVYSDGSRIAFFKWGRKPGSKDLCIVLSGGNRLWYAISSCSHVRPFVCEVIN